LPIPSPVELAAREREAIALIREWRSRPDSELHKMLLQHPARAMRHFIEKYHGHVKFRLHPVVAELAVEVKTVERAFHKEFGRTMHKFVIESRLLYAQTLLRMMPPLKISVVANELLYEEPRDFHYFFENLMHDTPAAWGRKAREKAKRDVWIEEDSWDPF
jgi:transcriptional regulator GlxA family with amidase domain